MKTAKYIGLALLALCLGAGPALSHKVITFAWVEDGQVRVEAGFGKGRPARSCEVLVLDSEGSRVAQGKTDDQGAWSFPVPDPVTSGLEVLLNAGAGHKGKWTIPVEELRTAENRAASDANANDTSTVNDTSTKSAGLKEKQALEKGPSLGRILLGIGIICLLAGGAALVGKRRQAKKETT